MLPLPPQKRNSESLVTRWYSEVKTNAKNAPRSASSIRTDAAGSSAGNYATYSGRILTPSTVGGSVAGVYNGNPWYETWNRTSATLVLVASVAAPPAGDSPPAPSGAQGSTGQVQLGPQVKQLIADEVKAQLAAEQSAAADPSQSGSAGVPAALNPAVRVFVVYNSFDVSNAAGEECALTAGDVVMRMTDAPDENQKVTARVLSSEQADCTAGLTVAIGVQDLQEMYNQLLQQVDSGPKTLAANSGKGSLPKAPDTFTMAGEVPAPAADPSAAAPSIKEQLEAQYQLVKMGSDSSGPTALQEGTVLAIQKGGILGTPWGSPKSCPAKYANGNLQPPGKFCAMARGQVGKHGFGVLTSHLPGAATDNVSDANTNNQHVRHTIFCRGR